MNTCDAVFFRGLEMDKMSCALIEKIKKSFKPHVQRFFFSNLKGIEPLARHKLKLFEYLFELQIRYF